MVALAACIRAQSKPSASPAAPATGAGQKLGALDLGHFQDLLADRLDRLVANPMIKPRHNMLDARRLRCGCRTPA
jgi:hypothetical protein